MNYEFEDLEYHKSLRVVRGERKYHFKYYDCSKSLCCSGNILSFDPDFPNVFSEVMKNQNFEPLKFEFKRILCDSIDFSIFKNISEKDTLERLRESREEFNRIFCRNDPSKTIYNKKKFIGWDYWDETFNGEQAFSSSEYLGEIVSFCFTNSNFEILGLESKYVFLEFKYVSNEEAFPIIEKVSSNNFLEAIKTSKKVCLQYLMDIANIRVKEGQLPIVFFSVKQFIICKYEFFEGRFTISTADYEELLKIITVRGEEKDFYSEVEADIGFSTRDRIGINYNKRYPRYKKSDSAYDRKRKVILGFSDLVQEIRNTKRQTNLMIEKEK